MKIDRRLGVISMTLVFVNLSLAKYLLVLPSFIVQEAGNSAWIVQILKGAAALGLFAVLAALYKPYTGLGLGEVNRRALGKFFGGVLNVALSAVIILRGAFLFRTLSEALRTLEAASASQEFMALFILVPVAICALKGFNSNADISSIIIPFTLLSVGAMAAILIPHFRFANITPILGEGPVEIVTTAVGKFGGFFEMIFLFIFSRYVSGYKTFKRSGLFGIGAIALITAVFMLMYCATVPYPASKKFFFPLYQLSRLIMAGAFIQHLEPLVVFIWAGIVLCSLTTIVLGTGELLASAAGTKDISGFVPILVAIIFFAGELPQSEIVAYDAYRTVLNTGHYVYIIALLFILLMARGRKIEKA